MMIGSTLKKAREKTNLSQYDMADLLKITKQTYMKWENDVTEPKASQIVKLAEILKISEKEICQGSMAKRISLEDFILRLNHERPSVEMMVMKLWENTDDHEQFFESLRPKTESEYYGNQADENFVSSKLA